VLQPVTGVCGNTNLLPVAIFVLFWQVRAFLVSAANGVSRGGCDEHSCMSRNNCCTHWPSLRLSLPLHFTHFAPCSYFTQIHSLISLSSFCFTHALTCRYTHNHRTLQNSGPTGCASAEWVTSVEPLTYAPHLLAAGYRTAFFGKYLNAYGDTPDAPITHVPPGWTKWVGLRGNSAYYDYELSIDGVAETHGSSYATDYLTDLVSNRSVAWLTSQLRSAGGNTPVLTVVHCPSPHRPAVPAPQYMNSFSDLKAPRTPSWNHISKDKHSWLSTLTPMNTNLTE
jgi:hypothetical protein